MAVEADVERAGGDAAGVPVEPAEPPERVAARQRVQSRRDWVSHLVAYMVVNGALVGIWALTGRGSFWPVWVLVLWAIGLLLHAWDVFWRRPVTEEDVDRELRRGR